ncbi:MAG: DUF4440 domain-containing protein [Pyrinomonadaceae bacterium]
MRLIFLGCVLALVFSASCFDRSGSADEGSLRNAAVEWDRLFNLPDLNGLSLQYSEDALSMPYNSPTIAGRTAILASLEGLFQDASAKHETVVDEVLVGDGWAIERARYSMTITPKESGTAVVETGRHIMCRKKIDGRWLIVWEIWNTDQPLATN